MRPTKWTETAIKQAFDGFIEKHDRLPTREEMYESVGQFPRPKSVEITLGITLGTYLELNYGEYLHRCKSRIYNKMTREYWIENFKQQYIKLGKPIKDEYNRLRDAKTPNSTTLTRIVGVVTWNDLLEYCGFQKDTTSHLTSEIVFEETLENYQKLSLKLQEILRLLK